MWLLPILIIGLTIALSFPLGRYMARVLDRPASGRIEKVFDTGPQDWKAYCFSLLAFNAVCFVIGYLILALQPVLPLNPDNKGMLSPSTMFNTACSFLSNTNLQHYSGEVHLSFFSQLFLSAGSSSSPRPSAWGRCWRSSAACGATGISATSISTSG